MLEAKLLQTSTLVFTVNSLAFFCFSLAINGTVDFTQPEGSSSVAKPEPLYGFSIDQVTTEQTGEWKCTLYENTGGTTRGPKLAETTIDVSIRVLLLAVCHTAVKQ